MNASYYFFRKKKYSDPRSLIKPLFIGDENYDGKYSCAILPFAGRSSIITVAPLTRAAEKKQIIYATDSNGTGDGWRTERVTSRLEGRWRRRKNEAREEERDRERESWNNVYRAINRKCAADVATVLPAIHDTEWKDRLYHRNARIYGRVTHTLYVTLRQARASGLCESKVEYEWTEDRNISPASKLTTGTGKCRVSR